MRQNRVATSGYLLFIIIGLIMMAKYHQQVQAHKIGDAIPMLKRIQFNEKRTEWSEVPYGDAPRFGLSKKITITGVAAILEAFLDTPKAEANTDKYYEELIMQTKDDLKLAFSFHHPNFETSWITLFSKGILDTATNRMQYQFLKRIDFLFIYHGDTIKEIKYTLDYYDENDESTYRPSTINNDIEVNYYWQEVIEKDTSTALSALYFISFIFGSLILVVAVSQLPNSQFM
ncbi:hypothetical protein C9374_003442 [Naegleria lovaniensis]|uniref:Uncharacterized protein n=1 Tax=Naegleria lovaniensis TaxID=51637 RepID=A0AA88GMW4_NAELO|nr:uncharacterized protein C9374_003442 [Naegleria lovaniensis]KAG2385627.1 hypothetical protein C9374_003442 [Naegleria lovaniensis]